MHEHTHADDHQQRSYSFTVRSHLAKKPQKHADLHAKELRPTDLFHPAACSERERARGLLTLGKCMEVATQVGDRLGPAVHGCGNIVTT